MNSVEGRSSELGGNECAFIMFALRFRFSGSSQLTSSQRVQAPLHYQASTEGQPDEVEGSEYAKTEQSSTD